jgi:hypothetical protein
VTPEIPKHGDTNYEDNPDLYEFKIQLGQHVLGMSTATPTWRADILAKVRGLLHDAGEFRKLRRNIEAALEKSPELPRGRYKRK